MLDEDAAQMLKDKKVAAAITGEGAEASDFSTNSFNSASQIVKLLGGDPDIVGCINRMEAKFRSSSFLDSPERLKFLATKPSSAAARKWIVLQLEDWVNHALISNSDISRPKLIGDKHGCGLIALLEFKMKCITHITDILMVQAKIQDSSRVAVRKHCGTVADMRKYTQVDLSWQGDLEPSCQSALRFLQEVGFFASYDNLIRPHVKQGSHPDLLLEIDSLKDKWDEVIALRQNEIDEMKAGAKDESGEASVEEDSTLLDSKLLEKAHQNPQHCTLHSPAYWRSVANQSVRTYVSFHVEPTTEHGLVQLVDQLGFPQPEPNKQVSLIHLDASLLGESQGPHQQPGLRKKFIPVPQPMSIDVLHFTLFRTGFCFGP